MKKLLIFVLLLSAAALCAACKGAEPEPADAAPELETEPFALTADYVVMRGDTSSKTETDAAVLLRKTLSERLGIEIPLATDWVKRGETPPEDGLELLVGVTNREETALALTGLRCDDFIIKKDGGRIVVAGGSDEATYRAVEFFLESCADPQSGTLLLPTGDGYVSRGSYPLDRLTLLGRDAAEYAVVIRGSATSLEKNAAERIVSRLRELYGVTPKLFADKETDGPAIVVDMTPYGDEHTYALTPGERTLTLHGNGEYAVLLAINDFSDGYLSVGSTKELDITMEKETVKKYGYKPLVEFNLPDVYPAMKKTSAEDGGVWEGFLQAKAELPDEATVLSVLKPEDYPLSMSRELFVSPDGDDANSGAKNAPLAGIQTALDKLSGAGGGVVRLRGGVYPLKDSVKLSAAHSGTDISPLFLTACEGETVTLTSGIKLSPDKFSKVSDPGTLARFSKEAADKIYVSDLAALGFTSADYGVFSTSQRPILFIGGEKQTIARYPNEGKELVMGAVVEVGGVTSEHSALYAANHTKTNGWTIRMSDDRAKGWRSTKNVWFYGAVYAEWNKQHYSLTDINVADGTITSATPCGYGARYVKDNTYYFYNILEELDAPGEWYLDAENGKLYVYPSGKLGEVTLVSSAFPLISSSNCKNVVIDGLTLTETMGQGINITDCEQNIVQRCEITGVGTNGLYVSGGFRNGAIYTTFSANGAAQSVLTGARRASLTADHNFLQNCVFRDPVIQTGTSTGGVGSVISHNLYDGTVAFVSGSNECLFEYNDFNGGSLTTSDSGLIYVNGHDLSSRGNHIRYNLFHDIKASHAGVYIDDMASGQYVYGNVVHVAAGTTAGKRTYRLHNGRECVFWNNISINATYSAFSDEANYYNPTSIRWTPMSKTIVAGAADKHTEAFEARYPIYIEYVKQVERHMAERSAEGYTRNELEDYVRSPAYNVYRGNIVVGAVRPFNISESGLKTAEGLDDNFISDSDPGFADMKNYDYTLKKDSEVFKKLPGFVQTPGAKMGLTKRP